jgi:hypothetical protein
MGIRDLVGDRSGSIRDLARIHKRTFRDRDQSRVQILDPVKAAQPDSGSRRSHAIRRRPCLFWPGYCSDSHAICKRTCGAGLSFPLCLATLGGLTLDSHCCRGRLRSVLTDSDG